MKLATARLLEGDKPWSKERLPAVVASATGWSKFPLALVCRLARWSVQRGRPVEVSVLLRVKSSGVLGEYSNLAAYVARGEARPIYKRAFDAQLVLNP